MKQFIIKHSIVLVLSVYALQGTAQLPKAHKLTPEEIENRQKITVAKNAIPTLSPAAKAKATDRGHAMTALILKAIMHRVDPARYPATLQPNSVEMNIQAVVDKISPATFDSISVKAKLTMTNPTKKANLLGKLKDIDFHEISLLPAIKKKIGLGFKASSAPMEIINQNKFQLANSFNKVDINISNVDCIARTTMADPYDNMVLSGLLVGASGNTNNANSVISCETIDGLTCDFGGYRFGTYSMNTTAGYPKTFYCIFVLITSMRDDPAETRDYFDALMSMVSSAAVSPDDGLDGMVVAVTNCMYDLVSEWILEAKPLIPYAVKFQLNNANIAPVNNSVINYIQTGDILEFGNPARWGKYRIKFFWQLRK